MKAVYWKVAPATNTIGLGAMLHWLAKTSIWCEAVEMGSILIILEQRRRELLKAKENLKSLYL
ncbi:unnamed protein product, partial [Ceratitis capitata]